MKTQFTPGPWKNHNGYISASWETGEDIGVCNTGATTFCGDEVGGPKDKRMRSENIANAALIASAPSLYAACECMEAAMQDADDSGEIDALRVQDAMAEITAALAMARGAT